MDTMSLTAWVQTKFLQQVSMVPWWRARVFIMRPKLVEQVWVVPWWSDALDARREHVCWHTTYYTSSPSRAKLHWKMSGKAFQDPNEHSAEFAGKNVFSINCRGSGETTVYSVTMLARTHVWPHWTQKDFTFLLIKTHQLLHLSMPILVCFYLSVELP